VDQALIEAILGREPYFSLPAPKSTGTDYFSPRWLKQSGILELPATDAMSTLAGLTTESIACAIEGLKSRVDECYVCGGGARNRTLIQQLGDRLAPCRVNTTEELGVAPDWVESCAFAWLAKRTLDRQPGNLPSVTNAEKFTILGAVYY
jgi:anhydro-N-acetylmuramic acid kinase